MKKLLLLLGLIITASQITYSNSIGIAYGVTSPIYHSDKNDYVLPLVDLKYKDFFVTGDNPYGLAIGYNVIKTDNYVLSLYGLPFGGYDMKAKDMKTGYKTIDDRKTTLMGGIDFTYYSGFFDVVSSVSLEYGEHGGNANLRISRPYFVTPKFSLVPTLVYTHYNSDFIDYYFGVEKHELNKTTYNGKSSYRYGIGLLGDYKLTDHFSITAFTGVSKVSDGISNSPIANKDVIFLFGTGVLYTF